MKKFLKAGLGAALGAALLVTATGGAAEARGWHGGGYSHGWHGGGYGRGWHGDGGLAIGAGLGILGLAAVLSAQDHARYDNDRYYAPPPPPPPLPGYYNQRGAYPAYDGDYDEGY